MRKSSLFYHPLWLISFFSLIAVPCFSQAMSNVERGWAQDMLKTVSDDIKKNYYDPTLHGLDWDAKVADAQQKISKAPSMGLALSYIASVVDSLNDSHTYFYPPERSPQF